MECAIWYGEKKTKLNRWKCYFVIYLPTPVQSFQETSGLIVCNQSIFYVIIRFCDFFLQSKIECTLIVSKYLHQRGDVYV